MRAKKLSDGPWSGVGAKLGGDEPANADVIEASVDSVSANVQMCERANEVTIRGTSGRRERVKREA